MRLRIYPNLKDQKRAWYERMKKVDGWLGFQVLIDTKVRIDSFPYCRLSAAQLPGGVFVC